MDDFNQQQDTLLDSALNQLPTAPLPPDFTRRVMVQIQSAAVPSRTAESYTAAPIRFRLQFLDVALALFWSLALVAVWAFVLWWTEVLPLNLLPQPQLSFSIVDQLPLTISPLLMLGVILTILELTLLGLVGVNLLEG